MQETASAEFGVEAAGGEEFVMDSPLGDLAAFENEDLIGMANGRESVRDDEAGTVLHEAVEGLLDEPLGGRVHTRGGFIEDEDRWIFEKGASDGEALFFTDAQFDTTLSEWSVEAFRKALDEIGGVCGAKDFPEFILGCVGLADPEVFSGGSIEEEALLGHDGDAVAKVRFGNIP